MSFFKKTLSSLVSIYLLLCLSVFNVGCKTETTPDEPKEYLPVSDLTVTAKYKQAVLTWTNPDDNELSSIEIKYGTNANKPSEKKVCNKSETTCTISDLENGTKYYFTVYAIYSDANNTRKSSATKTIETPNPEAVKNLKAESMGTDSIKLTWKNQTEDFYKSNKILYGTDSNKLDKTIKIEDFKTTATEVKELSSETKYYFQMVTTLSDGETISSAKVNATTDKEVAPEPEDPPSENNPSNDDDNGDEDSNSNNNENSNPSGNENNNPENQEDPEPENSPSENNPSNEDDNDQTNKDDLVNISSVDFAKKLTIGWNLGNTLDAPTETGWGMPTTTKEMIDTVAAAGFKTIRIPVSWSTHVSGEDYTINTTWMNRVKEIVDWAISDDMFVILNIHHDNLSINQINNNPGFAISDNNDIQEKSKNYISKVWTQIATKFANYDNHLIFEVLNEPRDIGGLAYSEGGDNTEFGPSANNAAKMNPIITSYEQAGLNAIRNVSGNENRFVMVPAYAASTGYLDTYTMPTDTITDKLLLSTHAYSPYAFAMGSANDKLFTEQHKADLNGMFNTLKKDYTAKGIGIVMGEASATDKGNTEEREKWATYYFTKAAEAGISVILWDNNVIYPESDNDAERHGWFNRKTKIWYYPSVISSMMEAAKTPTNLSDVVDCGLLDSVIESDSNWQGSGSVSSSKFFKATNQTKLKFTITSTKAGTKLKLLDKWGNDGTALNSGSIISGGTKSSDTFDVSTGTFIYQPTSSEWDKIKENGLIIFGCNLKVTKLELL